MQDEKKFKAVIVDDEPESRFAVEVLLRSYNDIEVIDSLADPNQALEIISQKRPHLLFLDILLQEQNAFSLIQKLKQYQIPVTVILFTSFDDYAIQAIKNDVFDYLLKPVDPEELTQTVNRFRNKFHDTRRNSKIPFTHRIKFNIRSGALYINPDEVIYCKADGNYTILYLSQDHHELISQKIGQVHEKCGDTSFLRMGRSTIINLNYLSKVDRKRNLITLVKNDQEFKIKVSSKYLKLLN